jgi:hypothetical protein
LGKAPTALEMALGISFALQLDLTLKVTLFWRTASSKVGQNSAFSRFETMSLAD